MDPEFQTTLDGFVLHRADVLRRRQDLRDQAVLIQTKVTGLPLTFADPDPESLERDSTGQSVEAVSAFPLADNQGDYGFAYKVDALNNPILDGQGKPTVFIEPINTLKDSLGKVPALATELPKLDELGLRAFIPFLQDKIDRANDTIDFSFLRVQTNVYRLRQLMLGKAAASRLVTSPALAWIADQEESAFDTRQMINTFLDKFKADNVSVTGGPSLLAAEPAPHLFTFAGGIVSAQAAAPTVASAFPMQTLTGITIPTGTVSRQTTASTWGQAASRCW